MDALTGTLTSVAASTISVSPLVNPTAAPTITEDVYAAISLWTRLSLWSIHKIAALTAWIVGLVTLTLPRWAFIVLSWGATVTLQLNFTKVAITLFIATTILSYAWKVKYLNRYTTLKEPPLLKDEGFDLHPDIATDRETSGFHNYLDEFLSAIKVFGYLEKPVFHELARHLQTRRLVAGDTLNLDQDKSFYIVVDGSVQVFAQTGFNKHTRDAYDDEDDNGWQLLNNVESGGTLSSLFTILSLFTEDVKLRYEEEDKSHDVSEFVLDEAGPARNAVVGTGGVPTFRRRSPSSVLKERRLSQSSLRSTATGTTMSDTTEIASPIDESDAATATSSPQTVRRPLEPIPSVEPSPVTSGHATPGMIGGNGGDQPALVGTPQSYFPDVGRSRQNSIFNDLQGAGQNALHGKEATIARATTDTTLAVIPAEAFRRLTKKYPNAAAHIVQVILTRLQRVTFLTAHKYLGLTREVVRTEKAINELANYPLPEEFVRSGGVHRLRQRFVPETKLQEEADDDSREEGRGYFEMDTPYAGPAMGNVFWDPKREDHSDEGVKLRYRSSSARTLQTLPTLPTRKSVIRKTGDLMMSSMTIDERQTLNMPPMTPRIERGDQNGPSPVEDFDLRDAVMECISKAIGLVQPAHTPAASVEHSPMFRPVDSLQHKAMFNSSFSSLSLLGLQGYDDESSITSSSAASFSATELENEVEVLYFPKGSTLVREGERNAGLYYVIEGFLDVSMPESGKDSKLDPNDPQRGPTTNVPNANTGTGAQRSTRSSGESTRLNSRPSTRPTSRPSSIHVKEQSLPKSPLANAFAKRVPPIDVSKSSSDGIPPHSIPLFSVKPGGIAGYLSSISGFASYVDITAKTDCYVGFLPAKALERIMDKRPIVLLTLAKRLISLLSPLILHIDSALDWQHVSAGQVLYREGEPANSFYIVINGRLRSINEKAGGGVHIHNEYGQGESVGELDCITASPRPSTLHAIRDTELVRMPMTLFNAISVRHPLVTIQISRIIASRLRQQATPTPHVPFSIGNVSLMNETGRNNLNLKTVAIVPVNRHVPVAAFAEKLFNALEGIGAPTSYLNQATVMQVLGRHAFSKMGTLKLAGWLTETEQKYRIVMYVADTAADCIMLVADGGSDSGLGEYEKLLVGMKTTARKELVLLHSERYVAPGTTRPWLKNRPWIHAHHHVEMIGATPETHRAATNDDPAPVVALRKIAKRVEIEITKYKKSRPLVAPQRPPAVNDFARLARRLCGKAIGVVLGGGGARGIAHIGMLKALGEMGIPVDMVGGTSIGAFVGGLYAREGELVSTFGRAKRFSGRMSTLWRILTDLTYPVVAYTTGHEFNRGIYKSFYDVHIEDMWLPYFCNTTNITHSRMDIHTTGYAWRYIRASMSLAGLLPPLCDRGDMLVDGGYVDNLPVSVMMAMGAASVFAVDVGSVDDTSPRSYGESVSGWWLLIQRWNPFAPPNQVPNITEIQSRLTYVSSVKMLEDAKATPGVLYMRMPVTQFGTMEFKRFLEILDVGYEHATKQLSEWSKAGKLPTGTEGRMTIEKVQKRGQSIRRNSI
ncbi:phosphatidylcholine and lysophosphatidylcholine phospholipase [Microbotryomycetes sp. JL201]|nr:phosphatidylcholine and lysophosphatidylcholine phospholipase [Microbotryomycetes sp. JL201]